MKEDTVIIILSIALVISVSCNFIGAFVVIDREQKVAFDTKLQKLADIKIKFLNFLNASMPIVDFSKEIDNTGSVDCNYFKTYNLTIQNNQSEEIEVNLLFNGFGISGLPHDLETDKFKVSLYEYDDTSHDIYLPLFENGQYTNYGTFLNLKTNETIEIPVYFKLSSCLPGTFMDGMIYPCDFLIYYEEKRSCMEVHFVVIT